MQVVHSNYDVFIIGITIRIIDGNVKLYFPPLTIGTFFSAAWVLFQLSV